MAESGIYIVTDPDQQKNGFYKISKTANIKATMMQLNSARANRDFKLINFFQCSDLKKAEEFIKSALKKRYIQGSLEWIKVDDEQTLNKVLTTVETLIEITNGSDD